MNEIELVLYCDFHGHSRKQNVFVYGCENKNSPSDRFKERIFPAMLSKNDPSKVCSSLILLQNELEFSYCSSSLIIRVNSKFKNIRKELDGSLCGHWEL